MRRIAILDYGIGNVRSIFNALKMVGAEPTLTYDPEKILSSDGVILPGVGAFAKGMENLNSYRLLDPIYAFIKSGKPFLGICLGMQMLLDESEEFGLTNGLGLVKGRVAKLQVKTMRLPHVSWNEIEVPAGRTWDRTIFNSLEGDPNMYFVHTFAAYPENASDVLATTTYDGFTYCSAVNRENVSGVQFHPEKSGETGLSILKNFVSA